MITGLLGIKSRMTQTFTRNGQRVPVTLVKMSPNVVTQIKTVEKDGYWALQLGAGSKKTKNIKKPVLKHLKWDLKNKKEAPRFLKEVRLVQQTQYVVGNQIKAEEVFQAGDLVQVSGVSKGKGFAGVVKRWGFRGGPKTHGQSDRHRAPGSIGQGTTPGRVYKGKKMAGRMGQDRVTVKNLTVLAVLDNELLLSGPVPGSVGGPLEIRKIGEDKKFAGLHEELAGKDKDLSLDREKEPLNTFNQPLKEQQKEETKDGSQE